MMKTIDFPPVWAIFCAVAAWLLAKFVPLVQFDFGLASVVLILAGFALIFSGLVSLKNHKTSEVPRQVPKALVTEGPFRINRNPIYTGMTVILVGIALWLGDISAFIPVIIFPALITKRFILGEEAMLRKAFPKDAEIYMNSTRRW